MKRYLYSVDAKYNSSVVDIQKNQSIPKELKSTNKGHPEFFAKIIQSQGCFPLMQTPISAKFGALLPPLWCQFYEK